MNLKLINERMSKIESVFPPSGIREKFKKAINRSRSGMSNKDDDELISETIKKYSANKQILNCYREAVNLEMQKMI